MSKKDENSPKKQKKEKQFTLRFFDIETNKTKTKHFDRLDKARAWAIDQLGPQYKIHDKNVVSNNLMKNLFCVKGTSPKQLLVDPLPDYPKARSGGFKANVEKRKQTVKKLLDCMYPGQKAFSDEAIADFTKKIFEKFNLRERKPKGEKKKKEKK